MEILKHYSTIMNEILANDTDAEWLLYPEESDTYVCANSHIILSSGVSRCAIIDLDYDWIVKFDIDEHKYCAREVELYQTAQNYGIADLFTECMFIGTVKNSEYEMEWDLYAYRKAKCNYRSHSLNAADYNSLKNYEHSPLAARYHSIVIDLLHDWGNEKINMLDWFCNNFNINDIHAGNVGYIDDKLVLVDFAGYHDESESGASD